MRAMLSNWKINGNGPIPFPFAFHSGIFQSYVMNGFTGISGMAFIIVLLLLLTAQRWRNPFAGVITFILFSSLALANEVMFGLIGLGFVLAVIVWMISRRSWKLPSSLLRWIIVLVPVGLAAIIKAGCSLKSYAPASRPDPEAAARTSMQFQTSLASVPSSPLTLALYPYSISRN